MSEHAPDESAAGILDDLLGSQWWHALVLFAQIAWSDTCTLVSFWKLLCRALAVLQLLLLTQEQIPVLLLGGCRSAHMTVPS